MGSSNSSKEITDNFPLHQAKAILKNILLARVVRLNKAPLSGSKRKAAFLLAQLEKVDNLHTHDAFLQFLEKLQRNDIINESSNYKGFYTKPISTTKKEIDYLVSVLREYKEKKATANLDGYFVYKDLAKIPARGSFFESQYTEKAREYISNNSHRLISSEGALVAKEFVENNDVINSQFHSRVEKLYSHAFKKFDPNELKKQKDNLTYYYAEFDERPNEELKIQLSDLLNTEIKRLTNENDAMGRIKKLQVAQTKINTTENKTDQLLSLMQKMINDPEIKARRGWKENNTVHALKELMEKVKNGKPLEARPRNIPRTP